MAATKYYGTGRRKSSTARVYMHAGSGKITVNSNVFNRGWQVGPVNVPAAATATGNTYTDGAAVSVMRN